MNLILDAAVSLLSPDTSGNTKIKIIFKIFNYIVKISRHTKNDTVKAL